MKTALEIRKEYGIYESHDTLQQLMILTNMLVLAKKFVQASEVLSFYETLVLEHEGNNSLRKAINLAVN